MSLQIWLPLNGDLHNQGLSNVTVTNNGTVINNAGKIGKCYGFSGSNQKLSVALPSAVSSSIGSLACWVKFNSLPTSSGTGNSRWFALMQLGTAGGFANCRLGMYFEYGTGINISINGSSTGGNYQDYSFSTGVWYHICSTYDGTNVKIYVNGIKQLSKTATVGSYTTTVNTLFIGGTNSYFLNGYINDCRYYNHALSDKEVEDISRGLVLHYKFDELNINLAMTSADYNNKTHNTTINATGWGGDTGTCTFYHYGGYNNLPYKVYHKLTTGSGGIYFKTANDITLEANTTYTMSCWIKGSRNFTASNYSFCINRGADNHYITYGTSFAITTNWQFFKKTFTTTSEENGLYGEMSIIYDDQVADYYVYYSGFKLEKGASATAWTPPNFNTREKIYDCSGYQNNGTIIGNLTAAAGSPRYGTATHFTSPGAGQNAQYHYIYTPLSLITPSEITFSFWYRRNESYRGGLISTSINTSASDYTAALVNNYDSYIAFHNSGGTTYNMISTNLIDADNVWKHIAFVWNGTNLISYKNGVAFESKNVTGILASMNYLFINYSNAGSLKRSNTCDYSDFRVYTTALSAAAIQELYKTSMLVDASGNITAREVS